jgi:hypothetical protein
MCIHFVICACQIFPFTLIFLTQYFLLQPTCDQITTTNPFIRFSWISKQVFFPFTKKTSSRREFRENRRSENHTLPRGMNKFLPVISIFPAIDWFFVCGLGGQRSWIIYSFLCDILGGAQQGMNNTNEYNDLLWNANNRQAWLTDKFWQKVISGTYRHIIVHETSNISIHFSSKYFKLVAIFIHLERTF